jgi:hypothetical protein
MDYNALTAWGTLGAVVVALALGVVPIWRERRDKIVMARSIRLQVFTLLETLSVRCRDWQSRADPAFSPDPESREALAELRATLPQLTLLTNSERVAVGAVYHLLSVRQNVGLVDRQIIDMLSKAVEKAKGIVEHALWGRPLSDSTRGAGGDRAAG